MREKQKRVREELKKVAKEFNLTEKEVSEVEESMWAFVKSRIQSTDTEKEESSNIYLRFLGTIFVAPNKIKRIKENIKRNENT